MDFTKKLVCGLLSSYQPDCGEDALRVHIFLLLDGTFSGTVLDSIAYSSDALFKFSLWIVLEVVEPDRFLTLEIFLPNYIMEEYNSTVLV